MEHEICRRETTKPGDISKLSRVLTIIFIVLASIDLLVFLYYAISNDAGLGDIFNMDFGYWYGIVLLLIFTGLAILFFYLGKSKPTIISLVLTDKRIYCETTSSKFKKVESYNLNKIGYYIFNQMTIKGRKFYTLQFTTFSTPVIFAVDEEFYNNFVNAVNATINVIE